jgi:hypothetical protein
MRKSVSIWLLGLLITISASFTAYSQTPPPNDNLTNATLLTGTDVTFTGTVAGATIENKTNWDGDIFNYPTGSIWWSWRAPATMVLNIELAQTQFANSPVNAFDFVNVYSYSNGIKSPAGLPESSLGTLFPVPPYLGCVSVPVTAGSNYLIELVGNNANVTHTYRLIATNTPLILKQPVPRTVYSNGSAFFYVACGGLQPLSYQWFFNGTNLPGQTFPILSFNNISVSNVGSYSVLVSNVSGSTMSAPAVLAISTSNIPPVLRPVKLQSNLLTFSLTGELGRAYLVQSSTNLADWVPENSFPQAPPTSAQPWLGNYVFTTNSPLMLTVTNNSASKYYRAYIYKTGDPASEICINNLQMIHIAKFLWAHDNDAIPTAYPADSSLEPYLPNFTNIFCPEDSPPAGSPDPYAYFDTSYAIRPLTQAPQCLINPAHQFPGAP